jgi:hypothetical protein
MLNSLEGVMLNKVQKNYQNRIRFRFLTVFETCLGMYIGMLQKSITLL